MELHTYFDPARERHEKDSMVEQNQWVFKLGSYAVSVLAHRHRNGKWITNSTDQEPYELAILDKTGNMISGEIGKLTENLVNQILCDVKECVSRGITLDEVEVVKISLRALEMKKYSNCISKL